MLRFFRQIRQRLLIQNKFSRYLLYAIGEILLVVIGILIALQVDNWNENRIQRKRYEFGIEKIHKRLLASSLYWKTYKNRAQYQIAVIDSLLNMPDSIPANRILGNVLVLDELIREWHVDANLYLDYLNFFPTDSVQFEIYESLRRYFYGQYEELEELYMFKDEESFAELLTQQNIPICDFKGGQSYKKFIMECSKTTFSTEYYKELIALISTKKVHSRLQLQLARCRELMAMKSIPERGVLETLAENFEFLNGRFNTMEIVGSGTISGSWNDGIKMNPSNNKHNIWQSTITLKEGEIKFRVDKTWEFSWGAGEMDKNKLIFGGPNIPVNIGKYQIVIDIENNTYKLNPL